MGVASLVLLQGLAIASSLLGYLLLARAALGTGPQVSLGEGFALLSIAALYGWWPAAIVASVSGVRGAWIALVILDLLWAFLAQGLAGFFFCALPLCPDLAPFGDLARYGSFVFGVAAAWSAWQAYRRVQGSVVWAPAITAVVLIVLSFAFQGANARFPGS